MKPGTIILFLGVILQMTSRAQSPPIIFYISDSSNYSPEFLIPVTDRLRSKNVESVTLIADSIIVNNNRADAIIIPTDLPLNEIIIYGAKRGDKLYKLTVKRINYSTVEYEYIQKEKKIIVSRKGLASLAPTFYYGVEGTIETKDKTYGMNKYIDYSSDCHTYLLIGVGNISESGYASECDNKKENIDSGILFRR
jgi:hypothetical protein